MVSSIKKQIDYLVSLYDTLSLQDLLQQLVSAYPNKIAFSTSFSYEDQVITHHITEQQLSISIFTLDTGRLFPETYAAWSYTKERYHTNIKAYYPDHALLEPFIEQQGPNAFYASVANRQRCCYIRKVEPLQRALAGYSVWITGLRAAHSPERKQMQPFEWDETNQLIKFHPLLHWSTEAVKAYIDKYAVPYNVLHNKGYASIGCAPCTRAITAGEDFRAGRWWWEQNGTKECGLHTN